MRHKWSKLARQALQYNIFTDRSNVDHLCYFCLVLLCFRARLFIDALWSPAGKRLTSWLSFVMCYFPIGILGQVWYLILSISDLCPLSYFSHRYQLEQFISVLRIFCLLKPLEGNSGVPDQTPRYAAFGQDLYCLPMSHKKDAM